MGGSSKTPEERERDNALRSEIKTFLGQMHQKYDLEGFLSGWMVVLCSSTIDEDGDPSDTCMLYTAPDQSPTFSVGLALSALDWLR
jgi:hypothetical protein